MTHFVNCTKSPNAPNFSYNCKKSNNTSRARPIMCVSSTNERKTQVRWATTVGQKVGRRVSANNTLPKRSPCHVLDSDEMIVRSWCLKASKKYSGDGCA